MAGFCELAIGLRAPKLAAAGAKSPIVSGGYLKYSRFWETATGDRVRSGLRGGRGSPTGAECRLLIDEQAESLAGVRIFRGRHRTGHRWRLFSVRVTPVQTKSASSGSPSQSSICVAAIVLFGR